MKQESLMRLHKVININLYLGHLIDHYNPSPNNYYFSKLQKKNYSQLIRLRIDIGIFLYRWVQIFCSFFFSNFPDTVCRNFFYPNNPLKFSVGYLMN